jgi:nucleoside-diphosphate-sugar epimerase
MSESGKKRLFVVTGACGFLGQVVVRHLRAADDAAVAVRGLDLVSRASDSPDVVYEQCDLTTCDESTLERHLRGADAVIHLAALVWLQPDRELLEAVHVRATERLLRVAVNVGVRAFVHTSSVGAISMPSADGQLRRFVVENDSWLADDVAAKHPTVYGDTKYRAEVLVRRAAAEQRRTRILALRLPLIYGLGDRMQVDVLLGRVSSLVPAMPTGEPFELIYVENAAHAHCVAARALIDSPALHGRVFNVSNEDTCTDALALWNLMLATVGVPFHVRRMPQWLVVALAELSERLYPLLCAAGIDARRRWGTFFNMTHQSAGYALRVSVRMPPSPDFAAHYTPLFDNVGSFRDIRDRLQRAGRLEAVCAPAPSLLDTLGGPNPSTGELALTAAGLVGTVAVAWHCGESRWSALQWAAVLFLALIDGSGAVQCASATSKRHYFGVERRMSDRVVALLCVEIVVQLVVMQALFGDIEFLWPLCAFFVGFSIAMMRLVPLELRRPFGALAFLAAFAAMRAASDWSGREWFPVVFCAKYFLSHFPHV